MDDLGGKTDLLSHLVHHVAAGRKSSIGLRLDQLLVECGHKFRGHCQVHFNLILVHEVCLRAVHLDLVSEGLVAQ